MPKNEGGMGFRDLKAFNLALLAKQGWRQQQNPNLLVHKVYKAKYFTKSSFGQAQLGKRPLYAWRSIMATKEIIKRGTRWCIGNGRSVHIWEDRWLPKPDSFRVDSPRRPQGEAEMVANLMDPEIRRWNVDKVRRTVLPHEAELVLSILVSPRLPEDSVIWRWTNNGRFSIRSAYGVAQKWLKEYSKKPEFGSCSDNSKMKAIWKVV